MKIIKGVFGRVLIEVVTKCTRVCTLGKYRTEVLGKVRYGLHTLPNTPVRFGTNSIRYPKLR